MILKLGGKDNTLGKANKQEIWDIFMEIKYIYDSINLTLII